MSEKYKKNYLISFAKDVLKHAQNIALHESILLKKI